MEALLQTIEGRMLDYFEKVKEKKRSVDGSQAPGQSKVSRQGSGVSGFQVSVSKVQGFEFGEGVNFDQDYNREGGDGLSTTGSFSKQFSDDDWKSHLIIKELVKKIDSQISNK